MTSSDIRSTPLGPAHLVALARTAKRNALTDDFCLAISAELLHVAATTPARAILLTGDGGHFCVGGDLAWLWSIRESEGIGAFSERLGAVQQLIRTVVSLPLPVIALIPGSAAGFGLDLALACDYRIAGSTAQLTSAFAKMGLVPDGGSSVTLRSLVGPGTAFRFLTGGEVLTADAALALGLVDEVVDVAALEEAGLAFTERMAAQPASSVTAIKALLRRPDVEALERGLAAEGLAQRAAVSGTDFAERAHAFLNRRKS